MKACSRSLVRSQMLTAFEGKHLWKHIAHFEAYSRSKQPWDVRAVCNTSCQAAGWHTLTLPHP